MSILRFISVSLLCFFLLGPVLVQYLSDIQKPKVLCIIDNSESINASNEIKYYKNEFLKEWQELGSKLGNDYDVEYLNIGGDTKVSDSVFYNQKKTNISQLFDYVNNSYARQNIGAVVFASDGIYNRGNNPVYKQLHKNTILYTVGMGDTAVKKDAMIKEVEHNAIAYLNNKFPLEINIAAFECKGNSLQLKLSSEGKILYSEDLNIQSNDFFKIINIELEADKPGTKHIITEISSISNEVSILNNRKDVFIDIIDGREKILLAYQGPHPDIGALKEAIGSNQNYEVETLALQDIKISDLNTYSVAILHQLPGKSGYARDIILQLRKLQIPIWCITGQQSAIEQMQLISPLAKIDKNQGRFNEAQAVFNSHFNAFTLEDKTVQTLAALPPLKVPYGYYSAASGAEIMAFQRIGQVITQNPLWAFSNQNGEKTAYLFGEGFWRWRLYDFVENENHFASNELVSKTIQYLAVKEDKRKFRVYPVKNKYEEDEEVKFIAEIYNASYEPVNTTEVKLKLSNSSKKVFNYSFSKNASAYRLELGLLSPDVYTFVASAEGIPETISGKLIITALQTEMVNTKADFNTLRIIAHNHNGKFFNARDLKSLAEEIRKNESITSIAQNERRPDELINIKWVFFLLILLISAEWFMRKYEGVN